MVLAGLSGVFGGCETTPEREVESLAFEKRTERYLIGLDETVTLVKGLPGGSVMREDGSLDSWVSVLEANERAWRNQHGSLSPELVTYSQVVDPTTLVPARPSTRAKPTTTSTKASTSSSPPARAAATASC